MAVRIVDHTPRIRAAIEREMARRLRACCILVWNHAKVLVNREGTTRGAGGRSSTGRFKSRKLVYGGRRSKPGEPPMKQTGRLLASIAWEIEGMVGRVGSNLKTARWLELGTRHMAARPWLRRALAEKTPEIRAIMAATINLAG